MSYDVNFKQSYNQPAAKVGQSAADLLVQLGGKTSPSNNPAAGQLEATFNKQIKNQMLPNRCQLRIKIVAQSPESCQLMAKAFPIDPLGNKLGFGVIGNAAQVVINTFSEELAGRLGG